MTISAKSGPIIQFRSSPLAPLGQSANQNPEAGPNAFVHSQSLLDPRMPFTYIPGQRFGQPTYCWLDGTRYLTIDQAPSAIAANNIAASQAPVSGTALTLVSSSAAGITVATSITRADTGATVTGLLAIDTAMAGVSCGEQGTMQIWDPTKATSRNVRITTNGDDTSGTYAVVGYDLYGYPLSEVITGVNNAVASGKKAFKYIASVTPGGTINSTAVTVGTGDVIGLPIRADRMPYLEVWWGNPQNEVIGPGGTVTAAEQTIIMPMQLADMTGNSLVFKEAVPFAFTVKSALFRTGKPASAGGKAATLTLTVGGVAVTGGVIALTTANQNTTGGTVAASAISGAGATGTAGTTIEFTTSSVTAFTEGDGWIEVTVVNNELQGGTFTAADTTTATTTTGDVRGTIALPTASDGTRRLTVRIGIAASNLMTSTGTVGVKQNLANDNGVA